jgi:hypothetical protein
MGPKNSIILCEPQCWGFEHASFNAALLQTVLFAYPGARVSFIAEKEHLACVRERLREAAGHIDPAVIWIERAIPARSLGGWKRLREEARWLYRLLEIAAGEGAQSLVLCSITAKGLLALKGLLHTRRAPAAPVIAVVHGILSTIENDPVVFWKRIGHLRQALRLPHPRQLTYLALGGSIYACLLEAMPRAARHFRVLDPPYFMGGAENPIDFKGTVRFGYFGTGRVAEKGFDRFVRLAEESQREYPGSEFIMVGFLLDNAGVEAAKCVAVRGLSRVPLSAQEYDARARSVTYSVGLANPDHYRLVANASFLDALCYLKPGIYVRNLYLEHYFKLMGDVGYLCDSYDEVRDVVSSVLQSFPEGRYRQQCENIRRGRDLFEPRNLAAHLRAIIAEGEEAL